MCPACGAANPVGQKFCGECGSRLVSGCPACGASVPPGQKFCGACGTPVPAAGAPGMAVAGDVPRGLATTAASERRLVSILFADLVGFTPFAEERDAELVRDTLTRYFELATEVIGRYGGTVEKFIGDAVMAAWGTPVTHEDDAERAVRAGLELVEAVGALGAGVRARAGIMTGEAAVTLGAVNQGMVAGDLVNTAARLQGVAPEGSVLVGELTREAAGRAIAFESAGPQVLKGKTSTVPAWRAIRVVAERGGTGRGDALEAPFTGRTDELRLLKEQFHAAGRERRARLVSLVGQAGIGKSRLAWELEKYLDGVVEVVRWHRGRSPAYGEGVTFWALGEMIRRRAGLAESDDPATSRAAITRMLGEFVPDAEERRWIEPRLQVLLGLDDAPPGGREELFSAWRTFFERLAASGTVALVFEDIHWADDGLLDFIEHLLDWSRNQPIFVLTLARPELLERRPGWGTDRRGGTAMRLDPLPEPAMRELLAGMAPGMPEPVVARILERADGIPLYAVETVRMLVADGRLAPGPDGALVAARDLGDVEVPATLQALVAARLDGLPAAERTLIQVAAVLGQSFTEQALAAVADEATAALGPRLAVLRRRELLVIETDPRAPSRGQHAFVQAIVREVAYGTLGRRDRRARHLAAARYFESLGDEELAGVLATHHLAAWRAAPEGPEGEAAAAQARVSLRAAADRAEALGARGQAADWLGAALEVTTDPADHAALLQRQGWTTSFAGRINEGDAALVEAAAAWRAIGDRASALHATALVVSVRLSDGRITDAHATADAARAEAEALADDPTAAVSLASYWEVSGRAAFRSGRYAEAIWMSDRSLVLSDPMALDEVLAMGMITKGTALTYSGHHREGVAILNGAYLDARAHGQHVAQLRAGVNLAVSLGDVDPRAAIDLMREDMAIARRLGLGSFAPYHASNLGAALRTGEWDWLSRAVADLLDQVGESHSRRWIEEMGLVVDDWRGLDIGDRPARVIEDAEATGDPQQVANGLAWSMDHAFITGDDNAAVAFGRRLLDVSEFVVRGMRLNAGRAALHAGDLALAERAVAGLEPALGGAADADIATLRAGIAAGHGRPAEALTGYRAAIAAYRDLGLPFDLALTGLDMAVLLGVDEPAVAAAAAEARVILQGLGAAPLVARLDGLVGGAPAMRRALAATAAPTEAPTPSP